MRIGSPLGREELAAEAGLLPFSFVREREQDRIEEIGVDAGDLPACVEIGRLVLPGDEAPVDIGAAASRVTQTVQRRTEALEQLSTPVGGAESVDDLFPSRFMDSFRKVPALDEGRDGHNTMILLCCMESKRWSPSQVFFVPPVASTDERRSRSSQAWTRRWTVVTEQPRWVAIWRRL